MSGSAAAKQNLAGLAAGLDTALVSGRKTDPTVDGRNVMWIEKYRPRDLDDVAAHKENLDTIKKLMARNQLPHLLLYGPPGTGKTSTIKALARRLYGNSMASMTLELNASDERGIDVVREEIQDFASTKTIFSNQFKLIILDECDAMTKDAQMALRRVIEKYTRNARFCLVCNYVSKVIPALQSRCTKFRFAPLPATYVETRLKQISDLEGVKLGDGGLEALVTLGGGDMRRTLNILQSCHMAFDEIDEAAVYTCTGHPLPQDIQKVTDWLFNEPLVAAFDKIVALQVDKGIALTDIVRELHPWMFQMQMPARVKAELVEQLAELEYRLAYGTSERLQLGALVATFVKAREQIAAAAV